MRKVIMSSKKAERRDETTTAEIGETVSAREYSPHYQRAAVNRALDETKDNIRRSIDKAKEAFTSNWMSPRYFTEIYANMVSRSADNMIAATRLVNNMMFANMDAYKTSLQQAKDN